MLIANTTLYGQSSQQIRDRKIKEVIVKTSDDRNGKHSIRTNISHYDKKGRLIEFIELDMDSVRLKTELHQYDKKGNEVMYVEKDNKGKEILKYIRTFDKWKNETMQTTYENEKVKEVSTSQYNASGNKIEEIVTDANKKVLKKIIFVYDLKGMLVKRTTLNEEGKIIYCKEYNYSH